MVDCHRSPRSSIGGPSRQYMNHKSAMNLNNDTSMITYKGEQNVQDTSPSLYNENFIPHNFNNKLSPSKKLLNYCEPKEHKNQSMLNHMAVEGLLIEKPKD